MKARNRETKKERRKKESLVRKRQLQKNTVPDRPVRKHGAEEPCTETVRKRGAPDREKLSLVYFTSCVLYLPRSQILMLCLALNVKGNIS